MKLSAAIHREHHWHERNQNISLSAGAIRQGPLLSSHPPGYPPTLSALFMHPLYLYSTLGWLVDPVGKFSDVELLRAQPTKLPSKEETTRPVNNNTQACPAKIIFAKSMDNACGNGTFIHDARAASKSILLSWRSCAYYV